MEHLSNDHGDCPNQHKNSHKLCDETGHPLWIWGKANRNWDMIRISQWRECHCRTNTSFRRNKPKRAGLWESQSRIWVGKLTIWVRLFEITEFTRSVSSTKDKHISRQVDRENQIYVRWNRIKNYAGRWKRWSIQVKVERHWVW